MDLIYKCPKCDNIITCYTRRFPMMNDQGWIVIECDECKQKCDAKKNKNPHSKIESTFIYVSMLNPDESSVKSGGRKIKAYDAEMYEESKVVENYPTVIKVDEHVITPTTMPQHCQNTDCRDLPNMICSCGVNVAEIAESKFLEESESISKATVSSRNMHYRYGRDYKHICIKISCTCACGCPFDAYFAHSIKTESDFNWNANLFHLVSTSFPISADNINGVKSKDECMSTLKKFLARWNIIADKIILISPFIGNIHQTNEQLAQEWKNVVDIVDAQKTTLYTRKATISNIRKTYQNQGIDENVFISYGLEDDLIKKLGKSKSFHAKIYAGIIGDKVEFLSGSFNLVSGKNKETINYQKLPLSTFKDSYLTPLGIDITEQSNFAMFIKKEKDDYDLYEEKCKDIYM